MSAREDLLLVAERLAVQARVYIDPPKPKGDQASLLGNHEAAATLAHAAKSALEAAALVDAEPAPIIAATERLHEKLTDLGVEAGLEIAAQVGAAESIDAITEVVEALLLQIRADAGRVRGYALLHNLCEALERDFTKAETETASRIAARIHSALEEAEQTMGAAKRGEG